MKKLFAILSLLLSTVSLVAQGNYGYTAPPDWSKSRITDIGVVVSDMAYFSRKDLATQKVDTVLFVSEPEIIWQSENVDVSDSAEVAVAMKPRRATRKKMLEDDGRWQWGNLNKDFFINFNYYVYRFEYPSVNAEGNTVFLSAIAACPTPKACS